MEKNLYKTSKKIGTTHKNYETSWNIYKNVLDCAKIKPNEKVLDAGCGNGELKTYFKEFELYGFDFHKDAIDKAKKKGYKKLIKAEITKLPYKDKEFDKTISIQVFQYLENPKKAFKELFRITKKEIILSVPNFTWLKVSSYFSKKFKIRYDYCVKYENYTDEKFLRKLGKVKIHYVSNKFPLIRNIFGKYLSSEIIAVYNL